MGNPRDAMLRTRFCPITARPVSPKCIPPPGWIGEGLVAGVVAMGPFYQRPSLRTLWRMFEDLEAAGLFEGLPDEEYRRTIARHLLDVGFSDADVTAIVCSPDPGRDATFRLLFPEPRLTAAEFAARIDLPVEKIDRIRLAAGLPPTDSSSAAPVFSARDEGVFAAFGAGSSLFGEDVLLQFVRVMGFSLAQIAEAAIALFATHVATPLTEQHAPPDVQFKAELDATAALASIGPSLETLFRFHADTAIRRLTRAQAGSGTLDSVRLTVGFIDLVGFTPLSEHMETRELGRLFDEFEGLAFDVIAQHDARLVKLIGDAVMFTTLDPDAACDIALDARGAIRRRREPGDTARCTRARQHARARRRLLRSDREPRGACRRPRGALRDPRHRARGRRGVGRLPVRGRGPAPAQRLHRAGDTRVGEPSRLGREHRFGHTRDAR